MLFALSGAHGRAGAQSLVIRLAAAGGEGDLPGLGIQAAGKDLPGRRQLFRRQLAGGVQAGGIAVKLLKAGQHGRHGRVTDRGGGSVVGINVHKGPPISYFFTMI